MSYETAFDGRSETVLVNIIADDDVPDAAVPDEVDFSPYDNPSIAVDTSARFAVHDIIGGTTVRQKVGEDPSEISMSGVCTEGVAVKIDKLKRAKLVTVISDRIDGGARCQVPSCSTDPLEDGGAADMDSGDFLYEFNINLIQVEAAHQGESDNLRTT